MDYDTPLNYYNGKTAYEVSKEGFSKHISQQWTWFTRWMNGTDNSFKKATEIKTYSPLDYGLYYTSVGNDIQKNDMMENITDYAEQIKQRELEIREEGIEEGRKEGIEIGRKEAREKGIKCIVEALKEMGKDDFVIINKISEKYEISLKDAEEKVKKYS